MRVYALSVNDDNLNEEQREQVERAGFDYEDFGMGDYRRFYYLNFDNYREALELVELLEGLGGVDWVLRSFNDTPD